MELRLLNVSGIEIVKLLEELAGSNAVIVQMLLDTQHKNVKLRSVLLNLLLNARVVSFVCSERVGDIDLPNVWSWQLINVRNDDLPGVVLDESLLAIEESMLVEPIPNALNGLNECDVVDGIAILDEAVQDDLEFFRSQRDANEVENSTELCNRHCPIVAGNLLVILLKTNLVMRWLERGLEVLNDKP